MTVIIGTSGWQYRDWRGLLLPARSCRSGSGWSTTHQFFATVESNNAFYRLPERATFEKWRERTPPDFRWAVKASRFLTHIKRLREPEEPVARLMERAAGLGDKLDTILLQLPPTLKADADLLRECLASSRPARGSRSSRGTRAGGPTRSARCWSATARRCAGPTARRSPSPRSWRTTDWGYLRFHTGLERLALPPESARALGRPAGRDLDGGRGRARLLQQRPGRRRDDRRRRLRRRRPPGRGDDDPRAHRRPGDRPGLGPGSRRRRAVPAPACDRQDGGVLGVPDAELLGRLAQRHVWTARVSGQRHDRALRRPGRGGPR